MVSSLPVDAKVLILSPRITFSKNICAEYNSQLDDERQFHCYLTSRKEGKSLKNLNFENKVVMSMEGIHYLSSFTPDLLIIDECNANLISHVSVETNGKNIDGNIYELRRMISYSKKIVVADAFLGSKVTNFFTDLKIPLHIYKYYKKLDRKKAIFIQPTSKDVVKELKKKYTNQLELKRALFKADPTRILIKKFMEEKKKVFAFISTRSKITHLEEELKNNYNGEYYSGVSQNEIPDNLNEAWSEKDLIATTSTITVGINHDKKDVFHTKIIDFSSASRNYVSDAIQSHYRIRHIIADSIYVSVKDHPFLSNTPVNMKKLEESIEDKSTWYKSHYKGYSDLEDYIVNLIKHNYLEHQLSIMASTRMMEKYLVDCNYEIVIDEDCDEIEIDEVEIDEVEEKEDDEKTGYELLRDFMKDIPNYTRLCFLEEAKLTRKLTESERSEIDKYWFINIYTGDNVIDMKLPVIMLAYRIWSTRFSGSKVIRSMKLEKRVLEGKITIKQLAEERWDKTQYAQLHNNDLIKIERVLYVCNKLGLKHCNDTETIIHQDKLNDFYRDAKSEYNQIQKDMGIRDTRKNDEVTERLFTGCIKSVFTEAEHSLCNLEVVEEKREQRNGKRVRIRNYGLVPNKEILSENNGNNQEMKNINVNEINARNVPKEIFDSLNTNEQKNADDGKPLKRLMRK